VVDGRLPVGAALPGTRELATELGFARGVVVEAYRRLADEGLVRGRVGSATTVVGAPHAVPAAPAAPEPTTATTALRLPLSGSRPDDGVEFDLSPGVPDLAAFPRAAWLAAERAVLASAPAATLGYGDPRGHSQLRGEIARRLARTRGVAATPDDVLVVAGVAQSLALLAHVLRERGAVDVAVEDPGSRGARDELGYWGLRPVPVPVDADGLVVEALTATGAPTVLVTPAHQFPTGVVLAPERRRALLAWARDGGLVIEDDYDAEHRYDRAPVPALHATAPEAVAHTGSTSKTLAPGLRMGWLIAPTHLRSGLVDARHATDLGSPALPQLVLAHLFAHGGYDRHLRAVRTRQRHRRDALVAAVRDHLPGVRVEGVAAGLHIVLTLPDTATDDVDVAARAAEVGVRVQPLSWHRMRPGPPALVVGYAAHPPDRLREAVARLAPILR
jgi:GntR family transcriptional regulator/MocR family aminotransferase